MKICVTTYSGIFIASYFLFFSYVQQGGTVGVAATKTTIRFLRNACLQSRLTNRVEGAEGLPMEDSSSASSSSLSRHLDEEGVLATGETDGTRQSQSESPAVSLINEVYSGLLFLLN